TSRGAERDRTVGLLSAIQALSQLSYSPKASDRGRTRRHSTQGGSVCNRRLSSDDGASDGARFGPETRPGQADAGGSGAGRAGPLPLAGAGAGADPGGRGAGGG